MAAYLGINSHLRSCIDTCLHNLKDAKATYLKAKEDYQRMRDRFTNNDSKYPKLSMLRKKKKMKMHWKSLRRYFGRPKMNLISVVKYKVNGILVRASS